MARINTCTTRPAPVTFTVQRGGRRVRLTYQQIFAAGHKLWLAKKYEEAAKVFDHVCGIMDRGPRAHILLAHCKAMLGDFAGCSSTLSDALHSAQYRDAAAKLHDVFVMWKLQFYLDVKQGLEKVIADHPELPTPCLILADMLMNGGNCQQPPYLLQQAIERDRPDGAIAAIARSELPAALEKASTQPGRPSARTKRIVGKNSQS